MPKQQQFAVIGVGRFGSSVASAFKKAGHEVLVIDKNEDRIEDMVNEVTHAVVADTTDESALRELGIRNMDVVVVAIGDDIQSSILTVLILKELGIKYIIAKAITEQHGKVLTKVGADRVVYPEREMGLRIAQKLITPNVLEFVELAKDYTMEEIMVPAALAGKTIRELDVRSEYHLNIIAINSNGDVQLPPDPEQRLKEKDILFVAGQNQNLREFEDLFH